MSRISWSMRAGETSRWWLWTSMNGNLARVSLCSGTRRIDLGSNSSMEIEGPEAGAEAARAASGARASRRVERMGGGNGERCGRDGWGRCSTPMPRERQTAKRAAHNHRGVKCTVSDSKPLMRV
jgi:hypothetical protein